MEKTARVVATLPATLHYQGEPTEWVRMTRPGQRLHSFLEGLTIGPDNNFYLVDVPYGRIFCVAADFSSWSEVIRYDGWPHGLAFAPDGSLFIADYSKGILRLDLETKALQSVCPGSNFKGLSDLAFDSDGNLWLTDPGRSSLSDPYGRLFKRTPEGVLACVLDNIPYPNGVALSADGGYVFIAVTRANAVWRLLAASAEKVRPMAGTYIQLSGGLGPDGLALSPRGELAVAHAQTGSVWLFDSIGDPVARIRTPGGLWTTSVRFGGPGAETLFIVDAQTGSLLEWKMGT